MHTCSTLIVILFKPFHIVFLRILVKNRRKYYESGATMVSGPHNNVGITVSVTEHLTHVTFRGLDTQGMAAMARLILGAPELFDVRCHGGNTGLDVHPRTAGVESWLELIGICAPPSPDVKIDKYTTQSAGWDLIPGAFGGLDEQLSTPDTTPEPTAENPISDRVYAMVSQLRVAA